MRLSFTKMHGLGNDFVVIDAVNQSIDPTPDVVRRLADRRYGVGCDQVLLVERARGAADFGYRIFNRDGGEVEQCGNGARCFLRFVLDKGLTRSKSVRVETLGGLLRLEMDEQGLVTVDMGTPDFAPAALPFVADGEALTYALEGPAGVVEFGAVSMGNPHAVIAVDSVENAPVATLGPALGAHERFPAGVNVGFMEVVSSHRIRLRVYERGAGETLACGTGACAAVAVGRRRGVLADPVAVELPGGELTVSWPGGAGPVMMKGPATTVFEGEIEL
ncbi:MAG: diaminopimelate epimerase [Gammaproteobacteria bacterium]|nr:diaminopimelate epimerase [Gammaproteobacteria bacterium]